MGTHRPLAALLLLAATTVSNAAVAYRIEWDVSLSGTVAGISFLGSCGVASTDYISILLLGGFGIGGGANDYDIDSGEEFDLYLDSAVHGLSYSVAATSGAGQTFVEAFDENYASLGVVVVTGVGTKEVASLFAGTAIRHLKITAGSGSGVRLRRIGFDLPPGAKAWIDPGQHEIAAPIAVVVPEIQQCGAVFRGSPGSIRSQGGTLGVSVAGGNSNVFVDGGEQIEVEFDEPVSGVQYLLTGANDQNANGRAGDHFVEGFDAEGHSLGLRSAYDAAKPVDLSDFWSVPISRFVLIGVADQFRLRSVIVVPEPLGEPVALGVLAWLVLRRGHGPARQRRDSTASSARGSASKQTQQLGVVCEQQREHRRFKRAFDRE